MEIIEKVVEGNKLKLIVNSNEESMLSLIKVYLEKESDVDVVGVYKEHHLIDKTEFLMKVKKGDPEKIFMSTLEKIKKDLKSKKVK